jgi:hypothetical protein
MVTVVLPVYGPLVGSIPVTVRPFFLAQPPARAAKRQAARRKRTG